VTSGPHSSGYSENQEKKNNRAWSQIDMGLGGTTSKGVMKKEGRSATANKPPPRGTSFHRQEQEPGRGKSKGNPDTHQEGRQEGRTGAGRGEERRGKLQRV